jgi:hypothetical protein
MAAEINTDRTRLSFSLPQMCIIIGAIVMGTVFVCCYANGVEQQVAGLRGQMNWVWTQEDMREWVESARNRNPAVQWPYPVAAAKKEDAP